MSGQEGELGHYAQAVKSRWWLIVLLMVIAVAGAYGAVGKTPPKYTASTTLLVTAPLVSPLPAVRLDEREGGGGAAAGFRQSQATVVADTVELISSRPVAERVAKRLDIPPSEVTGTLAAVPLRGTDLVRVSATSPNSQRAADIANAATEEFVAYFREASRADMSDVRRFVEQQLTQARARLERSDQALQAFRENRQIVSMSESSSRAAAQITAVELELDSAVRARQENEARLAAARDRLSREGRLIVSSRAMTENPAFRALEDRFVALEIERSRLSQIYTPQHPRLEQLGREITELRGRLLNEARTMVSQEVTERNPLHDRLVGDILTLEVERAAINARVEASQLLHRRRQAAVLSIPAAETEFNRLTREHRILETTYTTLNQRYQEVLLREHQAAFSSASLQVLEHADAPRTANRPVLFRVAGAAALAALVLGIISALLLETVDDRIRTAQDAERALGVPVLAQIPAHGKPQTAPATVALVVSLLLFIGLAVVAVARGYVQVPASVVERWEQISGVWFTADAPAWAGSTAVPDPAGSR